MTELSQEINELGERREELRKELGKVDENEWNKLVLD